MMDGQNYIYIGKGALRGFFISAILIGTLAIASNFSDLSSKFISLALLVITMLSIIYGAIYATKKIQNKGWLVGILVSILYMVLIYAASLIAGREIGISYTDVWRTLLALAIGSLAGMLGINL